MFSYFSQFPPPWYSRFPPLDLLAPPTDSLPSLLGSHPFNPLTELDFFFNGFVKSLNSPVLVHSYNNFILNHTCLHIDYTCKYRKHSFTHSARAFTYSKRITSIENTIGFTTNMLLSFTVRVNYQYISGSRRL